MKLSNRAAALRVTKSPGRSLRRFQQVLLLPGRQSSRARALATSLAERLTTGCLVRPRTKSTQALLRRATEPRPRYRKKYRPDHQTRPASKPKGRAEARARGVSPRLCSPARGEVEVQPPQGV